MMKNETPKNFRCRIIFSDIDGTLLNSSHHISTDTRAKILELDGKGIPFIMVSARMPDSVEVVRKELGNHRPVICYGGGLVLDEEGQVLFSRRMELKLAMDIENVLKTQCPGICMNAYGGNLWVVEDDENPWVLREEQIVEGKSVSGDMGKIFEKDGGIHKFLLMGEPGDIRRTEELLCSRYPALSVVRSSENYLEVMEGGVDKAKAVKMLCDYYGISPEEAAAFGDGENDVGMLKAVKYGFAMGNASELVKEQADFVTLSNDDQGLLDIIKRL